AGGRDSVLLVPIQTPRAGLLYRCETPVSTGTTDQRPIFRNRVTERRNGLLRRGDPDRIIPSSLPPESPALPRALGEESDSRRAAARWRWSAGACSRFRQG